MRDIVAQVVALNAHLDKIENHGDCDVSLACQKEFGSKCLLDGFKKEQNDQYQSLLTAISPENKKRGYKEVCQERSNVTSFLENLRDKARKINPLDHRGMGAGCTSNVEIKKNLATYLDTFLIDLEQRTDNTDCVVSKT